MKPNRSTGGGADRMAFAMDGATLSDECSLDPDEVGFAADGAVLSGAEQRVAFVNKHEFEVGSAEFEQACREKDARSVGYRCVKRLVDVAVSLVVVAFLVLLWPLVLMVLAAAAVSAHANPVYVQKRVGQYGRTLNILKLRTMVGDSDDVEKYLDGNQLEQWRKERKVENDPRITKVGAFLRKTSLDEIPQFINVLLGHMSIIGPRPVSMEEIAWYGEDKMLALSCPQGITGWWQITDRNDAVWDDGSRQEAELYYVRHASLKLDAAIFIGTFKSITEKTGR